VPGFPIRTSTDPRLVGSSPWLIAASHVLLRLQAPRHPPLTLYNLENIDARARYGILKGRATSAGGRVHLTTRPVNWRLSDGRAAERTSRVGRHRFGGTELTPVCSQSRFQRSLPQNGIVMPIANRRAHSLADGTSEEVRSAWGRSTGDSE
jgi:hypothetical protein